MWGDDAVLRRHRLTKALDTARGEVARLDAEVGQLCAWSAMLAADGRKHDRVDRSVKRLLDRLRDVRVTIIHLEAAMESARAE